MRDFLIAEIKTSNDDAAAIQTVEPTYNDELTKLTAFTLSDHMTIIEQRKEQGI
jgi:hypothetical protein